MSSQITSPEAIRSDPALSSISRPPYSLPVAIPFYINALLFMAFFAYAVGAIVIVIVLSASGKPDSGASYWAAGGLATTSAGLAAGILALWRLIRNRYRHGMPTKITTLVCCLVNSAEAIICTIFLLRP